MKLPNRPIITALNHFAVVLFLMPLGTSAAIVAAPPPKVGATVVSRGLDHRVWQTVRAVQSGDRTFLRTNAYKELKTGMHYLRDGELLESQEQIRIVNGYGVADQGQHRAIFSPSITDSPATDWSAPDGQRFQTRIMGIVYYNAASGESVLIAEPKRSIGRVAQNTVVYPDAFDDVACDVRYTYKIHSF